MEPAAAVEQLKARLLDAFDRFLEGVADNRQVAFDNDGWRRTRPSSLTRRNPTASPNSTAGWTPAAGRSGSPTSSSRSRTTSGSASTSSSQARSGSTPGRSARCSPRSSPTAATSACTPWRRSPPTSPTSGSSTSATGVSSRRTSGPRSPPSSTASPASTPPANWGGGTTSARDGQRFAMPQKVLQRTYSTRFNDFALEFYSFVADNYAPFYSPRDRVHRPRCALRARRRALPRERPRPRRALHRHPRLQRDQLRSLRDGRCSTCPSRNCGRRCGGACSKVEQLHALARAVYYGQRGRISAREVYDQMNACSCLTLILGCIVYWQAAESHGWPPR